MNDKNNILHGNNAKINPKKSITPIFENYAINNYRDDYRYGKSYHRLDDDAEFCKHEVDMNPK